MVEKQKSVKTKFIKIQTTINWAAAIAAVCLAAHSANACVDFIGVNFVYNDAGIGGETTAPGGVIGDWTTNVDALAPTETAGVPPLVQAHWNNLGRFGTNVTLVDSNGTASSVNMSWYVAGMFYAGYNGSYPTARTNDTKLMDGFLECTWPYDSANVPIPPGTSILNMPNTDQPVIFLTGLDSFVLNQGGDTYSVIIYVNTDAEGQGRVGEYWIDAASGTYDSITDLGAAMQILDTTISPAPHLFVAHTTVFNGSNYTMVPLTATNTANSAFGNYIEYDGLTNDTILIRTQNHGNPSAPIAGIQIFSLGVAIPPLVTPPSASPTNVISLGSTVKISFSTYGCGLSYQWQTDGGGGGSLTNIPGATNSSVVTTPTTVGTWNYDVMVTNSYGSLTSLLATVTVLPASAPILTTDIGGVAPDYPSVAFNTNVFGFIGGNVQFHAEFNLGSMPITNQWVLKLDSGGGYTPIAGATGWYWTVTNVQSSKAGNYELTATNAVGSSNSSAAHLTALADPPPPSSNGVTNMYANCVMTNHPWAYWKFEETNDTFFSSMQAYDYSTHNFDAIYGNSTDGTTATGCKDGGESLPDVGPGGSDKYAGFPLNNMCAKMSANHANGYLLVPPLNLYTNTVTFTMWIKPKLAAFPKSTGLFMNRNGGDAAGIGFGTATNALGMPCLAYTWNTNSSATYGWNSGLFPVTNIWNFVACTITPSNTTMYLYYASSDGTNLYKAVNSVANGPEAFSGGTTWLGSDNWNNGYNFNGWIDEVAVFTNSLGENQITDLFLKALALQLWPFPPVFYLQPSNTAVFQGQTLQLTALASGIPIPTYYQWQFSNSTWLNLASTTGRIASNSTLTWQNFTGAFSNFRCIATNYGGRATSSVATVTVLPAPPLPPTNGLWTVNFAITPPNSTPYHGRGVLGTNMYWNALSGTFIDLVGPQFTNVPPSLLDDGATVSGINFGSFPIYLGWSGSVGTNNVLLDTFCSFVEGAAFIFTSVPNGIYKLALYGIDGASAGLGTIFTVNGVSQSVINAQDITFLPDNTVVYTNVMVTNGILEVTMVSIPRGACPMWGCSGAFNGAQLQLITYYGPNILSLTNSGKNMVLTYVGGQLLEATNMSGPWTTNLTATSPFTISPTGQMKFYRVYTNNIPQ